MSSVNTAPTCSQVEFPDPIPGIIPFGTVTLFGGAPGSGKTTMLVEWCARWLQGRTIHGKPTNKPTAVCYLTTDRQWKDYYYLLDAAGLSRDIPHFSIADHYVDVQPLLEDPKNAHEAFLYCYQQLQVPRGAILIVEPLAPLLIRGDQNRGRDVANALLRLTALCSKDAISILATMHHSKQHQEGTYRRHQDKIAGSTAFAGFSHTQCFIIEPEQPEKDPRYTFGWIPRQSKPETFSYVRDEETGLFVPYIPPKADRPALLVLGLFPSSSIQNITRAEIVEKAVKLSEPLTPDQVDRGLLLLCELGRVIRVVRGIYRRTVTQLESEFQH